MIKKFGTSFILSLCGFFLALSCNASPILIFDPVKPYLLLGVDNVTLNNESYNVRFNWLEATVFADQTAADKASQALIDQVFSQDFFSSLNICNISFSGCGASPVWLGTYPGWHGWGVTQLWGDIINPCPPGTHDSSCGNSMNQSTVILPSDGEMEIMNHQGVVGYLMACGDCGAINSVWKKQSAVAEPTGLALFAGGLISCALVRRKRRSLKELALLSA